VLLLLWMEAINKYGARKNPSDITGSRSLLKTRVVYRARAAVLVFAFACLESPLIRSFAH